MKILVYISRILTGSLFIVSGLIKANDPLGFSYKLQEYFSPDVLNLPFLDSYALELSVFICVAEILLGFAVLLGAWMRFVSWNLLIMILFFTFLTFYSAYFNKVTDCGCFGDAIKLTPWQSFYKDIVLLIFTLIIFIQNKAIKLNTTLEDFIISLLSVIIIAWFSFSIIHWDFPFYFTSIILIILVLIKNSKKIKNPEWVLALLTTIASIYFSIHVLVHLPIKDFRPFAIGKSIKEGMKLPDGAKPDKFETILTYKNLKTGESKDFNLNNYPWQDTLNWKWEKTESKLIEKGDHPPIHDFNLFDSDGNDITEDVLSEPYIFLIISHDINKARVANLNNIKNLAKEAFNAGYYVYGVTASSHNDTENFRHEHQLEFDYLTADQTVLKTIIRSNPGIVLLKEGTVIGKWSNYDCPSFEEIKKIIS